MRLTTWYVSKVRMRKGKDIRTPQIMVKELRRGRKERLEVKNARYKQVQT